MNFISNVNNKKSLMQLRLLKMKNNNYIGGGKENDKKSKNFYTKSNQGVIDNYSNSCMFISILDYLNGVLGIDINIHQLRQIGRMNDTENHKMFDDNIERHKAGLQDIVNMFNLDIHFLNAKNNIELYNKDDFLAILNRVKSNGNDRNLLYIVSSGEHFELLVYNELWGVDLRNFFPNLDFNDSKKKFLVFSEKINTYIDINELKNRNKILNDEIKNIESELKSKREILKLVSEDIKIDVNLDIGQMMSTMSSYKAEVQSNNLKIKSANELRDKYKAENMKKNKKVIEEYMKQFGSKKQFAIDTLLKARVEFENNLKLLDTFSLSEEDKEMNKIHIQNELKDIDDALRKLNVI